MAKKVQVVLEDDLDGTTAAETVRFALDGVSYEIDLSAKNAAKFRDAFVPYMAASRRLGRVRTDGSAGAKGQGRRRATGKGNGSVEPATVRAWARAQGIAVSERGRVSSEIVSQYQAAMA